MQAQQVFNKAVILLGYDASNIPNRLKAVAVENLNIIYADLWRIEKGGEFTPITSLSDEIKLSQNTIGGIMLFGVCMRLAQSESDGDQQQTYTYLYNGARARLSQVYTAKDRFIGSDDL